MLKMPKLNKRARDIMLEVVKTAVVVVGVLAVRSSVASTYVVPTGSMIPTILPGDRFIASQLSYGLRLPFLGAHLTPAHDPVRGDIVVFPSPVEEGIDLVKRVVAVGGDTVEFRSGKLYLNGHALPLDAVPSAEPGVRLYRERLGTVEHLVRLDDGAPGMRNFGPIQIPAGHFFVMGDNRDHSADSRYFGPVEDSRLRAKGLRLLFSLDPGHFPYLRVERVGGPLI